MMKVNYEQAERMLGARQPFRANSLSGRMDGPLFKVYSYSTIIGLYYVENDIAWVSTEKYSKTTTRQQNMLRRAWGPAVVTNEA